MVSGYFCYLVLIFPSAHLYNIQQAKRAISSPDIAYSSSSTRFHSSAPVIRYKFNCTVSFEDIKAGQEKTEL